MDPTTFDRLTRIVSSSTSRRGALAALLGALGVPRGSAPDAEARRRKTKGRRRDSDTGRAENKQRKRKQKKRKRRKGDVPSGQCCDRQGCAPGKGKNLQRCCFDDRVLTARTFTGANLGGASFARADLTGANFAGANLDQTCFVDANATGTRFGNANRGKAIFCRTETASGVDNSGCDRGTPCCPTCDAAHPCGQDQVCCDGRCIPGNCCDNGEQSTCGAGGFCCNHRCVAGDCCAAADCPTAVCQRRACDDHQCVYTPVFGESGPGCPDPRLCCRDDQGDPVCCDPGVTICQTSGVCGCAGDEDCGAGEVCCGQQCVGGNCCRDQDCPSEVCRDGVCRDHVCGYAPVSGEPGPGCDTLCCQDKQGAPVCCAPGTRRCQESGVCGCRRQQDCIVGNEVCCDGQCHRGICCQDLDCPPFTCQARVCRDHACFYSPVFDRPGPDCPTWCCRDLDGQPACCEAGTSSCQGNGICGCETSCQCLGNIDQVCSEIFGEPIGTPCCPGFICHPNFFFPLLTTCQFPCETDEQCVEKFGHGYHCDLDDTVCPLFPNNARCCRPVTARSGDVAPIEWPMRAENVDALAKLVWAKTSRGTAWGTMAGTPRPRPLVALTAGRRAGNGFAFGLGAVRTPWRGRR